MFIISNKRRGFLMYIISYRIASLYETQDKSMEFLTLGKLWRYCGTFETYTLLCLKFFVLFWDRDCVCVCVGNSIQMSTVCLMFVYISGTLSLVKSQIKWHNFVGFQMYFISIMHSYIVRQIVFHLVDTGITIVFVYERWM